MVESDKKEEKNNNNKGELIENSDTVLLDGATSNIPLISPEMDFERQIAIDIRRPIEERLESFEVIVDSEVGDTHMSRARNIEREVGLRQIYLKFEGGNPTGTQKDRVAFEQAMDALRRGYDDITVATCGNYGAAIALASSVAGLKCHIYIPEAYHTKRLKELTDFGAVIKRVPGDYEEAVRISRVRAEAEGYYDANPGGGNTDLQLKAYGQIAFEIYDELRDAPLAVAAPVSNGTTLAGIYRGFQSLYRRGKTSRIPLLVAGSSYGKNPIVHSFIKNIPTCIDLDSKKIKETAVNEPLINWRAMDGDYALDAIRKTKGWAAYVTDKSMLHYSKLIREREGLSVLPASTAGLIALIDRHKKEPLPGDRYVVILTGRKA